MSHFTPVPKPIPALPKRKQFGSSLPMPTKPTIGRNKERQAKEFARCYGSEARVEWMKHLPCIVCGTRRLIECAHTRGGGAGRKADARHTVPLCQQHHRELHTTGIASFESSWSLDLEATADRIEADWQSHQRGEP